MSSFLETKQQTQATTIENLRLETGWKFNALLIKETECTLCAACNDMQIPLLVYYRMIMINETETSRIWFVF